MSYYRPPGTIGGSDIPLILGVSPYGGPFAAYRRIVEGYSTDETAPMKRGKLFEPVVRSMYVDETGATLETNPGPMLSKKHPFMHASVDDLATRDGAEIVCEYKTASFRMLSAWGQGADEVPQDYLCQVGWYLAATQRAAADLAVLIGGDEFRVYRIVRDMELEALMLQQAERFYRDHILPKRPPPDDGSASYSDWLTKRYPESRGNILEATPEIDAAARALAKARADIEEAERREKAARNTLCAFIADADGVKGRDWKISYKTSKGRASVDWETVVSEAKIDRAIIDRNTKRTPYRVFKPTFAGEK